MTGDEKLTGRTRFRATWRGKLILQVEARQEAWPDWTGTMPPVGFYLVWRDARAEDLTRKGGRTDG